MLFALMVKMLTRLLYGRNIDHINYNICLFYVLVTYIKNAWPVSTKIAALLVKLQIIVYSVLFSLIL